MYLWTIPNGKAAERIGRVDDVVNSLRSDGTLPYFEKPIDSHDWIFTYMIPRIPPLRVKIDRLFSCEGERVPSHRAFLKTGSVLRLKDKVADADLTPTKRVYPLTSGELRVADYTVIPYAHEVTSSLEQTPSRDGTGLFVARLRPSANPEEVTDAYRLVPGNHHFKNRILIETFRAVLADLRPLDHLANTYGAWMLDSSLRRRMEQLAPTSRP